MRGWGLVLRDIDLTLTMLRLLSSKTQGFFKSSKPCHVGIHWIAIVEFSQKIEYPFARVSVLYQLFCIVLYWPN